MGNIYWNLEPIYISRIIYFKKIEDCLYFCHGPPFLLQKNKKGGSYEKTKNTVTAEQIFSLRGSSCCQPQNQISGK